MRVNVNIQDVLCRTGARVIVSDCNPDISDSYAAYADTECGSLDRPNFMAAGAMIGFNHRGRCYAEMSFLLIDRHIA